MNAQPNIIICDKSALFLHLHCDGPASIGAVKAPSNLFKRCAATTDELAAFNFEHPLYGGGPIDVLVRNPNLRRSNSFITTRLCTYDLDASEFYELREGLYVMSPELAFARAGYGRSETQLIRIGVDLCARYYLDAKTGDILDRSSGLTTPERMRANLKKLAEMRGASKAMQALKRVVPNSGSPAETLMYLQFCCPSRIGGFGLPFHAMNYDVSAGKFARFAAQDSYCIDMVNLDAKVGLEYDGALYHCDASADKRRRNELAALGWKVFPIDKSVMYDPDATERAAYQIAKALGVRIRKCANWERRFLGLRRDLGLPV